MTAVVAILNKSCVALAADSAGTIIGPNGPKISNNSNKLFTLSKYHPVGVMIYNSSELSGVPWEILIKTYRNNLGDTTFAHLNDYVKDFIHKLKDRILSFPPGYETRLLSKITESYLDEILEAAQVDEKDVDLLAKALIDRIILDHQLLQHKSKTDLEEYADYTFEAFKTYAPRHIQDILTLLTDKIGIQQDVIDKLLEIVYNMIKSDHFTPNTTGIVFTGYGEQEQFPACISYTFDGIIDGRIRYKYDEDGSSNVNETIQPAILPFAQRDVIDTFLSGISQEIQKVYNNTFSRYFLAFQQTTIDLVQPTHPALAAQIAQLDVADLRDKFHDHIVSFQEKNYKIPTEQTVAISTKEELAEMAESLVYLTYLKRKTNFELETVGGPIDVAVITKGDGFIWIKRKHYFKPELNNHFFQNYLRVKHRP